jgi:hypothetical protein
VHAQETREARQAAGCEIAVAVGHDAADGRWVAPLCIAEAAAEQELPAIGCPYLERTKLSRETATPRVLRDHYLLITALSGVILITMGVMLFTGELTNLNIKAQEWLDGLGLNFFKSV